MDNNSPENYFKQIPPVTRFIVVVTFFSTLGMIIGFLNPRWVLLDWTLVFSKLHIWRLFSDYIFIGPFSFGWVFHVYFLITFSSKLEIHPSFSQREVGKGGYLFFLFLQMIALDLLSLVFYPPKGKPLLAGSLSFAIIYYWSKKEPFAPIGFWGFQLTAWQTPYALLVLDVLMGRSIWDNLMGMATGHLYHFLRDVLPIEKNIYLLNKTPSIFGLIEDKLDFLKSGTDSSVPSSSASRPGAGGFAAFFNRDSGSQNFPGRGYRLGDPQ